MAWVLRLVALWGIVDSLLLLLNPRGWSRWWGRWIRVIGERSFWSRAIALVELALSLYLLSRRAAGLIGDSGRRSDPASAGVTQPDRAFIQIAPSRLLRSALRVPVFLYRAGLGGLFGHHFLLLTHRGRKSGRVYQTVLEVVRYEPESGESVVVSGWGERSDW